MNRYKFPPSYYSIGRICSKAVDHYGLWMWIYLIYINEIEEDGNIVMTRLQFWKVVLIPKTAAGIGYGAFKMDS